MSANDNLEILDVARVLRVRDKLLKFWQENVRGIEYDPTDLVASEEASLGALSAMAEIAGLEMMENYLDGDYGVVLDQEEESDD